MASVLRAQRAARLTSSRADVVALARRVQSDRPLTNLIRRKFAIKCTTGYSLNALVDFPTSDPIGACRPACMRVRWLRLCRPSVALPV